MPKTVADMGTEKHIHPPGTGTEGRDRLSAANRVPGHLRLNHQHLIIGPLLGPREQGPVCKEAPGVHVAGTRGLSPSCSWGRSSEIKGTTANEIGCVPAAVEGQSFLPVW